MKKVNIVMIIVGVIVILFVAFCPLAQYKSVAWRIAIGFVGFFSLASGIYKIARKTEKPTL